MAKLLRVLTVIIVLLSAGSVFLGTLLFAKRELLKGRTQKLEKAVLEISAFVEEERESEPRQKAHGRVRDLELVLRRRPKTRADHALRTRRVGVGALHE